MKPYRIEILDKQDRTDFDCGVDVLNLYLKRQAGQEQRKNFSVCYLLVETETEAIAGFYTLSSTSFPMNGLPESVSKKLPRYSHVPAARVGRSAVDQRFRGQGLGALLLADAVKRSADAELGIYAIVVDAKDSDAIAFYEHFGFIAFADTPDVLYLPVATKGLR